MIKIILQSYFFLLWYLIAKLPSKVPQVPELP